jgi:broad specificity phosphatase PhoE
MEHSGQLMSTLVLIRHGQASFFEKDYDKLSAAGETQARLLGAYWAKRGVIFDEVYAGPRVRQRRTAELVGESYLQAGLSWPEPVIYADIDEHQVDQMLRQTLPELCERRPHIREHLDTFRQANTPLDRHKTFQRLFEAFMKLWIEGEVEPPSGIESWTAFRERVQRGINRILAGQRRGRKVAAFTSVGPIVVTLQLALGTPDWTTWQVGWRVRNCSLTEFVFTQDRFTLDGFNAIPHLDEPALWTYR